MPETVKAAPKKIILCCDGTSQSSVSGELSLPSNITRIARTIAKAGRDGDQVWQQLVYYDAGVATGALSWIESVRQGATGDGLITNVLEAYNFVVNNYSPGDKIYCFGFSRGAFTARAIAGMITDFGVIKPDFMKDFPSLFTAYQKNTKKYNFRKTKEYFEWYAGKAPWVRESEKETYYPKVPFYDMGAGQIEYDDSRSVELVGVFDTVGSLGLADTYLHDHADSRRQYEWLNVKWNPYIKHAFHALALDDRRQPFLPTLYYIPNDNAIAVENEALKSEEEDWPELAAHRRQVDKDFKKAMPQQADLRQVWFTGVHINIGGGTDEEGKEEDRKDGGKTDLEGLANLTFAWMVDQCRPYLAFEDFTNNTIAGYLQRTKTHDIIRKARKGPDLNMKDQVVDTIGEAGKWLGSFLPSTQVSAPQEKLVRSYCFSADKVPTYSPAHWTLFRAQDSYVRKYHFSSPADRTPGACHDMSTENRTKEGERIKLRDLGQTNEWMHPSVWWRIDKSEKDDVDDSHKYKSTPLKDFKYREKNGVWGWQRTEKDNGKDVWIPEWPITAAIRKKGTSVPDLIKTCSENGEIALIEQCQDYKEVLDFLNDHAAPYGKAYSPAEYKDGSYVWMRV